MSIMVVGVEASQLAERGAQRSRFRDLLCSAASLRGLGAGSNPRVARLSPAITGLRRQGHDLGLRKRNP